MAKKNRVEVIARVNTVIVPTVTNALHRGLLNDDLVNSVMFERDVIATETPVAGLVTIDYSNKDTATVITAVNLAVSFSNLENGAVKYLVVTKAAANIISFVGVVNSIEHNSYINSVSISVCYRISSKNGIIYVEALVVPVLTAWQSLTLATGWSGYYKYRINDFTGKIEMIFDLTFGGVPTLKPIVDPFPANIEPNRGVFHVASFYTRSPTTILIDPVLDQITAFGFVDGSKISGQFDYYKTV